MLCWLDAEARKLAAQEKTVPKDASDDKKADDDSGVESPNSKETTLPPRPLPKPTETTTTTATAPPEKVNTEMQTTSKKESADPDSPVKATVEKGESKAS